jgi:CheY-like chemotaxis protein
MGNENQRKVLVVDDEPLACELLVEVLGNEGYSVASAANGEEAFTRLCVERPPFSILITDIRMPILGGDALIRRLRAQGFDVPLIVAVSADLVPGTSLTAEMLALGVRTLAKPYRMSELLRTIAP